MLQWAPAGSGDPEVLFTPGYTKGGSTTSVGVIGATPGEALCAMLGEQSQLGFANAKGEAHLPVVVPKKTTTSSVDVANADGVFGTADINTLGKTKLRSALKKQVRHGKKQPIKVAGLAPGESVSISITWPTSKGHSSGAGSGGQANGKGVFKASFKVPGKHGKPGKAKVKVAGEFGNRKASKTFTVTR